MGFYTGPPRLLKIDDHALGVQTPYDRDFVNLLKSEVSVVYRAWDGKMWLVDPMHTSTVIRLIEACYGEKVIPPSFPSNQKSTSGVLEIHYLGTTKEKNDDHAFGLNMVTDKWDILIPKKILQDWFDGTSSTQSGSWLSNSLFEVLGIPVTEDEDVIKAGFRKMAMHWHPDVCKEPDAEERFKRINDAYALLKDDKKRTRYMVGLKMNAETTKNNNFSDYITRLGDYRTPVRSGKITCEYKMVVGRYLITGLSKWDDILNEYGNVLVPSWDPRNNKVMDMWVHPDAF